MQVKVTKSTYLNTFTNKTEKQTFSKERIFANKTHKPTVIIYNQPSLQPKTEEKNCTNVDMNTIKYFLSPPPIPKIDSSYNISKNSYCIKYFVINFKGNN